MDSRLLDLLVCPVCKGPLDYNRSAQELSCPRDLLAFPVRDGIPVMLVEQARDQGLNIYNPADSPSVSPAGNPTPDRGT